MEVFLFPLVNVTLFPKTTKPLNVFEPRYLTMMREAVAENKPVALGFIDDPAKVGQASEGQIVDYVRPVAGYGPVQIMEERLNGTLLVFIQGQGKVKLGPVLSNEKAYLICEAEIISENLIVNPDLLDQVKVLNKILAKWIKFHIPDVTQREVFMSQLLGPEEIVGAFAAYLVKDYDLQQMILELDSINEKIEFLYRLAQSNEVTV